jgi:hypothetical protein
MGFKDQPFDAAPGVGRALSRLIHFSFRMKTVAKVTSEQKSSSALTLCGYPTINSKATDLQKARIRKFRQVCS